MQSINACLKEVRDRWYGNSDPEAKLIMDCWDKWSKIYRPISDDIDEYLFQLQFNQVPYHIPLKVYIATDQQTLTLNSTVSWGRKLRENPIIDTNFTLPEVMVAAMNSVVTEFNRNPPGPRLYSVTDESLLADVNYFHLNTIFALRNTNNFVLIPNVCHQFLSISY